MKFLSNPTTKFYYFKNWNHVVRTCYSQIKKITDGKNSQRREFFVSTNIFRSTYLSAAQRFHSAAQMGRWFPVISVHLYWKVEILFQKGKPYQKL